MVQYISLCSFTIVSFPRDQILMSELLTGTHIQSLGKYCCGNPRLSSVMHRNMIKDVVEVTGLKTTASIIVLKSKKSMPGTPRIS